MIVQDSPSPEDSDSARDLEDYFLSKGLPTRCLPVFIADPGAAEGDSRSGIPGIEVVIPFGRERDLFTLPPWPNAPRYPMVARTILFHLAMEVFSQVSFGRGTRISTNITNLRQPDCGSGGVLSYSVDAIVVGVRASAEIYMLLEPDIKQVARQFNEGSRYIKIASPMRIAVTPATIVHPPQLGFRNLDITRP